MPISARATNTRSGTSAIAKAFACVVVLLSIPACGIPPRRLAEPGPDLPSSFNGETTPDNSGCLPIDEFYRDPTLLALLDQALAGNRELRIMNEEVVIAGNEVLARSGAYLPFMTAGPMVGLDRVSNRTIDGAALRADEYLPGRFFSNPHGNFLIGANFTWQVDIYRQLRNARDAAGQRFTAAFERRNYFATRLVAEVAENYYRLMALDKRLENLDQIIAFQEQSLEAARARKEFARDTELAVLRFEAEVSRNRSEKLIIGQEIIEAENRINFLANRFPRPVERDSSAYYDLEINTVNVGVPSQLLQNRPDIRRSERELLASGLDVMVARVNFYPQLVLNSGVGLQSYNLKDLFVPQAVIGNIAGGFVGPLLNRRAIRAEYLTSTARQRQAVYDYQRTILDAFTEVVNRLTAVKNYGDSIGIKKQQLTSLESAVEVANNLFKFARTEYLDVLTAQRDLRDARTSLIDTKLQQLTAVVYAYQALGGGTIWSASGSAGFPGPSASTHVVQAGETFRSIARLHYQSDRYHKALWAFNKQAFPDPDRLAVGEKLVIPSVNQLDPALIEPAPAQRPAGTKPVEELTRPSATPATPPPTAPPAPPPASRPGPFDPKGVDAPAIEAKGEVKPGGP